MHLLVTHGTLSARCGPGETHAEHVILELKLETIHHSSSPLPRCWKGAKVMDQTEGGGIRIAWCSQIRRAVAVIR